MNYDHLNGQYYVRLFAGNKLYDKKLVRFKGGENTHLVMFKTATRSVKITRAAIGKLTFAPLTTGPIQLSAGDRPEFAEGRIRFEQSVI